MNDQVLYRIAEMIERSVSAIDRLTAAVERIAPKEPTEDGNPRASLNCASFDECGGIIKHRIPCWEKKPEPPPAKLDNGPTVYGPPPKTWASPLTEDEKQKILSLLNVLPESAPANPDQILGGSGAPCHARREPDPKGPHFGGWPIEGGKVVMNDKAPDKPRTCGECSIFNRTIQRSGGGHKCGDRYITADSDVCSNPELKAATADYKKLGPDFKPKEG